MSGDLLYTHYFHVVYTQSSVLLQDTVENENWVGTVKQSVG